MHPVRRILLLMLAVTAPAMAQRVSGTLSGIVTEAESGESVIGASVAVYADSASLGRSALRGAITNKFGFYSIAGIAPGRYLVQVRSIGLAPTTQEVTIGEEADDLRLDVRLGEGGVRTREVVVEADRDASPTGTISSVELRPGFMEQLPSLGGEVDVFRTLQLLPGVKSVSEVSSGLYVRGGSPDQNLILLDGVIVYNPTHLGGFLSTFNSDALRDVRLIKGAFPAEYGGRLSSVVDMTMREGTKEKISGAGGISLINSRLTVEGPITEDATFMVSGRRMYLDLLTSLAPESENIPTYYFYDANTKLNYRLSESDHLYLSGYFGRDVLNSAVGSSSEFEDRFEITWGNITGNLRWMHIVSPSLFTNFSAIYTDYDFSTLFEDQYGNGSGSSNFKSVTGIRDFMLRGEAQYFPHQDHIVKAGIESTEHRFRADASAELGEFSRIERDPTIRTSLDASVYLQDEWQITPRLSTNIGGRVYYFESGDHLRVEPRVSAAYQLTDAVSLKGAYSMGNQFLHLVARNDISLPTDVWFPSTETIRPSESEQGVLGVETSLMDGEYLVTVEGYYKTMRNVLEYKDTASFSLDVPLENSFAAGDGEAYGVELFLNKRMGSFTGWLGYTLAWTRRTFEELNHGKPFYPRHDRRHDISLVLVYRLGESWELGATWVYGTGQAYTVPTGQYRFQHAVVGKTDPENPYADERLDYTERNEYRLPAFHKLDLNFAHSFTWFNLPFKLSINIYNAYGRKNVFAQYVDREYTQDPVTGQYSNDYEYKFKRFTLFPFVPTIGLNFKF
jgi:outer membrane cobalamin receptor